jgi:ribosome-binding protein aMBF1 (putative translation factor)
MGKMCEMCGNENSEKWYKLWSDDDCRYIQWCEDCKEKFEKELGVKNES